MPKPGPSISTDALRDCIESVADQLCAAVDGNFDFRVKVEASDPSIEKLQMLINFVLDAARRSVLEQQTLNDELRVAMTQLEESCKRAEAANRAKSDFLANMSHELRTPLTAILGFTDIVSESANADQIEKLSTIRRNGTQLLSIIDDVLDLSKVESGEARIIMSDTEVVPLLLDTTQAFAAKAGEKQLELTCRTRTPIPSTVATDVVRVRQILSNLIGNATKFTARGWIRVEAAFSPAPANELHIDVIDTGIGLDQKDEQRVFSPFSQADTSQTRNFGGTGLGLTISRQFAQLLGGDVLLVNTRRGMGSHFRLVLPNCVNERTDFVELDGGDLVQNEPLTKDRQTPTDKPLGDFSILLVEDGPDNQRLINHILKKYGANVTTADNGQLALDAVNAAQQSQAQLDLILMDMQMPVMDGYTATQRLRAQGIKTPVIALTAHAMTGDREKCLNAGCDEYATKPINAKKLVDLIVTTAVAKARSSVATTAH